VQIQVKSTKSLLCVDITRCRMCARTRPTDGLWDLYVADAHGYRI